MTKSEFQALFKQVKEKMYKSNLIGGGLNDESKKELGLNNMDTIPINTISINGSSFGAIKIIDGRYGEYINIPKEVIDEPKHLTRHSIKYGYFFRNWY